MKKIVSLFALMFFSSHAFASTDCPAAKIQHLQPQYNKILYKLEGYDWHNLGGPSNSGVQAMYAAMLAAQMAGKNITVRYPGDYDCSAYELDTLALMVRTHN